MNAVVAFALKHRVLMVVLFVMMLAGGIMAFRELNIEAYPDRDADLWTAQPHLDSHHFALRSVRREAAVLVRLDL
jgi:hypothetical protein